MSYLLGVTLVESIARTRFESRRTIIFDEHSVAFIPVPGIDRRRKQLSCLCSCGLHCEQHGDVNALNGKGWLTTADVAIRASADRRFARLMLEARARSIVVKLERRFFKTFANESLSESDKDARQ